MSEHCPRCADKRPAVIVRWEEPTPLRNQRSSLFYSSNGRLFVDTEHSVGIVIDVTHPLTDHIAAILRHYGEES